MNPTPAARAPEWDYVEVEVLSVFLSYLFYADPTALTDDEHDAIQGFEEDMVTSSGPGHWATVDDSENFGICDVMGLAGDVVTLRYMIQPKQVTA